MSRPSEPGSAGRRGAGGGAGGPLGAGGSGGASPGAETSRCAACRDLYPNSDLDQQLWCPRCRSRRQRAERMGKHLGGILVTVPFAVWIAAEGSFEVLPVYAWLLPLAAAYYLGYRIGREVARGWVRWRAAE